MSVLVVLNIDPNVTFATVCKDEVINVTCSADGNHTYQLFENETLVSDGSNSDGMWSRTMSTGGVFVYKCVANNTQSGNVTVTVNGKTNSFFVNVDALLIDKTKRPSPNSATSLASTSFFTFSPAAKPIHRLVQASDIHLHVITIQIIQCFQNLTHFSK